MGWFRNLVAQKRKRLCRRTSDRQRRLRPALEPLEDRSVPTVVVRPHFPGVVETSPASAQQATLQSEPVVLVFAGSYWQTAQGQSDQQKLTSSAQAILNSPYLTGLQQYGSDGRASLFSSWTDLQALPLLGVEPTGQDLLSYVQREINARPGQVPPSSANPQQKPLYVVVNDPADSGPGQSVFGLNWSDGVLHTAYVGTRFLGSGALNVDGFTQVFSHELVEATASAIAVSDPGRLGLGSQISDNEPENGPGYTARVNGAQVQAYWSVQDSAWVIPDGSTTQTLDPIWSGGTFTGSYNQVSAPASKPAAGTGRTVVGRNAAFVITSAGALWQHTGTDPNTGWSLVANGGVTDVSVGVDARGQDAAFVNFGGTLKEHTGSDPNAGWSLVWQAGVNGIVTQISASQVQANTVFLSGGTNLWQHTGTDSNSGWSLVAGSGVTGFSAGVDATGRAAVFVNFGGTLQEHTGTDPNTGWSLVWDGGVTQFSASQSLADTVFVAFGTDLWWHRGRDFNSGWSHLV
jgi:hypothetical protein